MLLPAVIAKANPVTGVWSLVISQPYDRRGNYVETSSSCMFIYVLFKAVRLGLVADAEKEMFVLGARKAYEYIVREHIVGNEDWTVSLTNTVRVGSLEYVLGFDA